MKPIIATTLSGLFIKKQAWDTAHILWYKKASEKLKDLSINKWAKREDYFKGVDEVMKRLYPNLTDEKRTIKARKMFFSSVVKNIKQNPDFKNKEIVDYFNSLKNKYRLALITTNTKPALEKILSITQFLGLFDIIETSKETEKDDKRAVFDRFVKKHGKPVIYIGGDKKDSYDYCKERNIYCIFTNLENQEEIKGIKSIHNLDELKEKIDSL